MLVKERDLNVKEEDISTTVEVEFNTQVYKF